MNDTVIHYFPLLMIGGTVLIFLPWIIVLLVQEFKK